MSNPISQSSLAQQLPLADVHLPQAPGYWPLAWGWWASIAVILVGIAIVVYLLRQRHREQRARKEALQQLNSLNDPTQLNQINLLLRQTAMSYYPRQQVASLTGEQWLSFLDSHLAEKQRGFVALSENWQRGLFSPQGLEQSAFNACYQQAGVWLEKAQLPAYRQQEQEASNV